MVKIILVEADGAAVFAVPEIIIRHFDLVNFDMDVAVAIVMEEVSWLGKIDIRFIDRENCREVAGNNLHSKTANLENLAIDESMGVTHMNLFFLRVCTSFGAVLPGRTKMTSFSNLCWCFEAPAGSMGCARCYTFHTHSPVEVSHLLAFINIIIYIIRIRAEYYAYSNKIN